MRKSMAILIIGMLLILQSVFSTAASSFSDVPDKAYFSKPVEWGFEKGITKGTTATTFSPHDGCTRAQVVTFLWRAAGEPTGTSSSTFTDLPKGSYYEPAVIWAVSEGITNGTDSTHFSPDAVCTRGQIVTFLWRYAGSADDGYSVPFRDVIQEMYYTSAVGRAFNNHITEGINRLLFAPDTTCTRAQVMTFLYRYLKYVSS